MPDDAHSHDHSVQLRSRAWVPEALACLDGLYQLALYLTESAADAEDLVERTYASAVRSLDSFALGTSIKVGLYRLLRHTRRRTRATLGDADSDNGSSQQAAPEQRRLADSERVLLSCSGAMIKTALKRLPEDTRVLIVLDFEGLSEPELAGVLDCPVADVRTRVSHARAELLQRLLDAADPRDP